MSVETSKASVAGVGNPVSPEGGWLWAQPLRAAVLALGGGILLTSFFVGFVIAFGILLVLTLAIFLVTGRSGWGYAAMLLVCSLLGGVLYLAAIRIAADDISHFAPRLITVTGVVISDIDIPVKKVERQEGFVPLYLQAETLEGVGKVSGSIAVWLSLRSFQEKDVTRKVLPDYGDVVQIRGRLEALEEPRNPGEFTYKNYLERRGIHARLMARYRENWKVVEEENQGYSLFRAAYKVRRFLLNRGRKNLVEEQAGVLNGILVGARNGLSAEMEERFERTGTVHVLATAGLHVAMVTLLILVLLRWLGMAARPANGMTIALLILYAIMADGRPSVVRAVVMASAYLIGRLMGREPDKWNALALAGGILLVWNPLNLFDAGFQLSFLTVATIIALMPLAENRIRKIEMRVSGTYPGARVVHFVCMTLTIAFFLALAAQLGSWPMTAYYFNIFLVVSVPANTLVVPWMPLIIGLGFMAAFAPFPISWVLYEILRGLLGLEIGMITFFAGLPFASIPVESPPILLIVVYYGVLWAAAWWWQRRAVTLPG